MLRTVHALFDIAPNYASGEEAVGAVFECNIAKGKAKQEEHGDDPSSKHGKKKKKKRDRCHTNSDMVTVADRSDKRTENTNYFEQLLEKPYTNHVCRQAQAQGLYADEADDGTPQGSWRRRQGHSGRGRSGRRRARLPRAGRCLMIFDSAEDSGTRWQHKLRLCEVSTIATTIPKFLNWFITPIFFNRSDHLPRPAAVQLPPHRRHYCQ